MNRKISMLGLFLGALAIVLGAFGAHGLKKIVEPEAVVTFEVGVRYQMYHALFLLFVALSALSDRQKSIVALLTLVGVCFFSGSIYGLATNSLHTFFDFKRIALITPLGGLCLILAWVLAFFFYAKKKK